MKEVLVQFVSGRYRRFECEECHNRYYTMLRAIKCETEHIRERDLDRNLKIILECMPYLFPLNLRGCAAIYRMYRQLDISPKEIADLLIKSGIYYVVYGKQKERLIAKIREIIGEVFRFFCENSNSCVLKPYLRMENPVDVKVK